MSSVKPWNIGIIMDPIDSINPAKDTSFALALEAQRRGHTLYYLETKDLFISQGKPYASVRPLKVMDDLKRWFALGDVRVISIDLLDLILMRKDPPVDANYIYTTMILELAVAAGCRVANRPSSLLQWNEKIAISHYPQCCVPTVIDQDMGRLKEFVNSQPKAVLKPLDGMGGASIFITQKQDPNLSVILETLTKHGTNKIIAQRYIPEISQGDKRILMIDGKPVPYALARIPAQGEGRANLAAGGRGVGVALSERDRWICSQVAQDLQQAGLMLVGLDVIGDWLTEINVTSPTCMRELDQLYGLNIAGDFFAAVEKRWESEW